jgi:hypothetical protein
MGMARLDWMSARSSVDQSASIAATLRRSSAHAPRRAGAVPRKVAMGTAVCRAVIRSSASLRTPRGERRDQGRARSSMTGLGGRAGRRHVGQHRLHTKSTFIFPSVHFCAAPGDRLPPQEVRVG